MAEFPRRSVSELLRDAANRLDDLERASISGESQEGEGMRGTPIAIPGTPHTVGRHHPVDAEVSRLFSAYTNARPRQPARQQSRQQSRQPRSTHRYTSYTHQFCCLAKKDSTFAPTPYEKDCLQRAGLGASRLNFQGDRSSPGDFQELILSTFPKLKDAGGFELMKIRGSTRSRQLVPLPCPNRGYTVDYLRDPSLRINHTTIYIRPLQLSLSMEQEASDVRTDLGPQTSCILCGEQFPFSEIRQHNVACARQSQGENEDRTGSSGTDALTSQEVVLVEDSLDTGSAASSSHQQEVPSGDLVHPVDAWVTELDPIKAAQLFTQVTREAHRDGDHLLFNLSLQDSVEDRNRAIISFYKRPRVQWANQLHCKLTGDAAIGEGVTRYVLATVMDHLQTGFMLDEAKGVKTLLFEGEQDHLVPSTSRELQESDMFVVAGRILAHCFLNDGPRLYGLSHAVIHVLFGGLPETATLTIEDCVDHEVREVVTLLEGTEILQEEEKSKVLAVCLPWDLPGVTTENRWWLRDKILIHAVLGRTSKQIKQLKQGLKETGIWEFLSSRPDCVANFFPRASETEMTPEMILDKIVWPEEDHFVDVCTFEEQHRALDFLRRFIETSTSKERKLLMQFWTGWDVVPQQLDVEIAEITLPQSSTCFFTLKLPKDTNTFDAFRTKLMASISSSYAGFGQY